MYKYFDFGKNKDACLLASQSMAYFGILSLSSELYQPSFLDDKI